MTPYSSVGVRIPREDLTERIAIAGCVAERHFWPRWEHADARAFGRLSATIGADPALRAYVRRAILEGTTAGVTILDRLVGLTIANLHQYADREKLPAGNELSWLATQIAMINLVGTLLEPLLPGQPFSPREVRRRTAANRELIAAALARYAK